MKIVTHKSPDMDALVATYIYTRVGKLSIMDIQFKSVFELKVQEPNTAYIDISPKEITNESFIFDHHDTDDKDVCAATIVWDEFASAAPEYESLVAEALLQDTVGDAKAIKKLKVPLLTFRTVLNSYKKKYTTDDRELTSEIFKLFDLIVEHEKDAVRAANEIKYAIKQKVLEIVEDEDTGIVIALQTEFLAPPTRLALFTDPEFEVDFIIYKVGKNIGITRNADRDWPDLQKLESVIDEPGWFFHKAGFLAARGSEKHPSVSESKYEVDELTEMLINLVRDDIDEGADADVDKEEEVEEDEDKNENEDEGDEDNDNDNNDDEDDRDEDREDDK